MEKQNSNGFLGRMTRQECILWFEFLSQQLEPFRRGVRLGEYVADFYCESANLAVLVDRSEECARALRNSGVNVALIRGNEITDNFADVCARIDCQLRVGSLSIWGAATDA